jgi:hypothetical protein
VAWRTATIANLKKESIPMIKITFYLGDYHVSLLEISRTILSFYSGREFEVYERSSVDTTGLSTMYVENEVLNALVAAPSIPTMPEVVLAVVTRGYNQFAVYRSIEMDLLFVGSPSEVAQYIRKVVDAEAKSQENDHDE